MRTQRMRKPISFLGWVGVLPPLQKTAVDAGRNNQPSPCVKMLFGRLGEYGSSASHIPCLRNLQIHFFMAANAHKLGFAVGVMAAPAIVPAVEMRCDQGGMDWGLLGEPIVAPVAAKTLALLNALLRQGRPVACGARETFLRVPVVKMPRNSPGAEVAFHLLGKIGRDPRLAGALRPDEAELPCLADPMARPAISRESGRAVMHQVDTGCKGLELVCRPMGLEAIFQTGLPNGRMAFGNEFRRLGMALHAAFRHPCGRARQLSRRGGGPTSQKEPEEDSEIEGRNTCSWFHGAPSPKPLKPKGRETVRPGPLPLPAELDYFQDFAAAACLPAMRPKA